MRYFYMFFLCAGLLGCKNNVQIVEAESSERDTISTNNEHGKIQLKENNSQNQSVPRLFAGKPGDRVFFDKTKFNRVDAFSLREDLITIRNENVVVCYGTGYLAYSKGDLVLEVESPISENVTDIEFIKDKRTAAIIVRSKQSNGMKLKSLISIENNELVWCFGD